MAVTREEAKKIFVELAELAKKHNIVIWWRQRNTEDVKFVCDIQFIEDKEK